MSYNVKIIRTRSYIEIYEYGAPIISGYKKDEKSKDEKLEIRAYDDITENEQLERLKRMAKTRQNAKWNLMRLIDSNFDDRTSFLTLTTKENIESREIFNDMFDKFITRFNYHFLHTKKRILKYIATLEKQERGAYHAHILLFDIGYLDHKELTGVWGHGFVWINKLEKLDDSSNAGRYIGKYMEKGVGQELLESKGKKAYYSSRNLKKPLIKKLLSNEDLSGIVEYNQSSVLYESEYTGKAFRNGKYVESAIKYRKIKLERGEKSVSTTNTTKEIK